MKLPTNLPSGKDPDLRTSDEDVDEEKQKRVEGEW